MTIWEQTITFFNNVGEGNTTTITECPSSEYRIIFTRMGYLKAMSMGVFKVVKLIPDELTVNQARKIIRGIPRDNYSNGSLFGGFNRNQKTKRKI